MIFAVFVGVAPDHVAKVRLLEMIVSMVQEGRTAAWLEGLGIDVDERMLNDTVEQAIIRVTEGKKLSAPPVRPEESMRSEISDVVREKLQSRLREAVSNSVRYITVFEALRRLPQDRDVALSMLIRHKNQVAPAEDQDVNLSIVTHTLSEDDALLEQLGLLMERKDPEMRMIAANLPPYRHIYTPDQTIGKFTVDAKFVDDLRELSHEELSERPNSEDTEVGVKAAADIKCMVALLTNLLNSTSAFHKELRRLLCIVCDNP